MTDEPEQQEPGLVIYIVSRVVAAVLVAIVIIAPITVFAWLCKTLKIILTGD